MPTSTEVPLAVFEEHIRQIEQGIRFVQIAGAVKRCVVEAIDYSSGKSHAINEIDKFLKVGEWPEQQHCNANFISLVAGFEEYLRQTLESAVRERAQSVETFDDLRTSARDINMKATGFLLTLKDNPPQQLRSLDFFEVCKDLGTCLPGAKNFKLNPEAISIKTSLLDLDNYIGTLNKFDYQISWDKLGSDKEIKKCMGVKRTRDAVKAAKKFVAEMIKQRNRVAHTGSSSDITPAVLEDYLLRLLSLARAITCCLT